MNRPGVDAARRLGKYELGRKLGKAANTKLYVCTDTESSKEFAARQIDKGGLDDATEERLKREIALMSRLCHRNVIRLYEVLQTQRHYYVVMELIDKIMENNRLDEPTARRYFHQLIAGLHHCHGNGIAHRDLKPENLLITGDGVLKISDFGLANVQVKGRLLSTSCGSPSYIAPEVVKEQPYDGLKSDLWSCGVVLFVMLAGFLPFEGALTVLFNKIERGDYRIPDHFSPQCRELISGLLMVDVDRRLTLEGVIQHPWFQVGWDASLLEAAT